MEQNKTIWIIGVFAALICVGTISYAMVTQKQREGQFRVEIQQQYSALKDQMNNFSQKLSEISSNITSSQPVNNQPTTETIPDENQPFQMGKGSYFGTLTVKGYVQVSKDVPDCGEGCEEAAAPKVDVVSFNIISNTNKLFDQYLTQDNGNSFEGSGWISLGCKTADKKGVESYNAGDSGTVNNLISGSDFTALMNSSKTNLVNLQITKPYYTSGKGASTCYSHFRNFKVVK